jgi:hypothetical protein
MIGQLRKELESLQKARVLGLDIETITYKKGNDWKIVPFEIGLYHPVADKGITVYVNPYYWNNLARTEPSMFFYPREKYREGSGYVCTLEQVQNVFRGLKFQTIYDTIV